MPWQRQLSLNPEIVQRIETDFEPALRVIAGMNLLHSAGKIAARFRYRLTGLTLLHAPGAHLIDSPYRLRHIHALYPSHGS
jgi:hypothetical protein